MWVWFSPALLPGYAWSFPLGDGTVNVGVARRRRRRVASSPSAWRAILAQTVPRIARRARLGARRRPARAWPIPTRLSSREPRRRSDGGVLFVGDAAGAADPFTGEGIGQALETGIARRRGDRSLVVDRQRRRTLRDRPCSPTLGRDHRLGQLLSAALRAPGRCARRAARSSTRGDFMRRNVGRWLFEDYPRSVVASPRSWSDGRDRTRPEPFADGPSADLSSRGWRRGGARGRRPRSRRRSTRRRRPRTRRGRRRPSDRARRSGC